jgi:hypothetical protein
LGTFDSFNLVVAGVKGDLVEVADIRQWRESWVK